MNRLVIIVFFFACAYVPFASSVRCKARYPTLGNKVTAPNLPDTECKGPHFEDLCYVMFTDYNLPWYDKEAYTYGCIFKVTFYTH